MWFLRLAPTSSVSKTNDSPILAQRRALS